VATEAPVKVVRLKVRCTDEAQFRRELANRIAAKLFVPTSEPLAKDDLFSLQLKFADNIVRVKGTARVITQVETPKKGVQAKFVSLDADSIQFALDFAPFEDTDPVSTDTLLPTSGEHAAFQPSGAPKDDGKTPARGTSTEPPPEPPPPALPPPPPAPSASRGKDGWSGGLQPLDVLANYQLLDRLGAGGMAEVYAARATLGSGVEKIVALKLVLPEFGPGTPYGGLFLNEAKISASLSHPSLIQVFDFGEAGGRPYLAMEYLRGRDLTTCLKRMRAQNQKLPVAFAVHVALEVAKALDYLHTRTDPDGRWLHLVHRDVSPGNILLSENGEVKLVDFGVAAAGNLTSQHQLVAGKYSYMAPEQTSGQAPSPSWDLYALGVVLYEMLTLQPLFDGDTVEETSQRQRIERHRPPSEKNTEVSTHLDAIVLRATQPDKVLRYHSAKQLKEVLQTELRQLPPADVGAVVRNLFSSDLADEKKRLDGVFLEARAARSAGGMSVVQPGPVRSFRRKLAGTRLAQAFARRPMLARGIAAVSLAAVAATLVMGISANSRSRALEDQLARYDAQVAAGSLAGPGGDTALDHLVAARQLAPQDGRVKDRAKSLATLFETLADRALTRGDDAEAAVHLQGLLLADPGRPGVTDKLKEAEARVRNKAHAPKPVPPPAP
jgi:serine/threonine-protein kinase